jgi:hypothetical protein
MKIEKLSREELFNSVFRTEHFVVEGDNVERLWELYSIYNQRRYKENYSKESYDTLIKENRFNYGAMILYRNDEVVAVTGLSDYKNWIIFTRLVIYKYTRHPLMTAYLIPDLVKKAMSDGKDGLIATFNAGNMVIKNELAPDRFSRFSNRKHNLDILDHEMFQLANKVTGSMIHLDYTVNYKNTEQLIVYYPFNDSIPPFEPYHKI